MIVLNGGAVQVSFPPLLINPPAHGGRPVRAVGGDTVRDLEGVRIELENRDAAENIAVGIEELIVINVGALAEDPLAVGAEIGLRGLALDAVAERVLPLVGVGEVELIGQKQDAGDQGGGDEDRHNNAIKTDASGFDGGDFIGALQQSESDQHGQQHAQRRRVVKEIGHYVQQVFPHRERRDLIPHDVAQQLEQSKDQQQHEESGDDHRQVQSEVAQHIIIEDGWEMKIEQAPAPGQSGEHAFAKGRSRHVPVERRCSRTVGR